MENQIADAKLFRNLALLTGSIFFLPLLVWLITGHIRPVIIHFSWLWPYSSIMLFVGAKRSYKQFKSYWLPIVLVTHLAFFLGCVAVSLITGYTIDIALFSLYSVAAGILSFIFWGFFSVFMFNS